jgi:hypothetical protein
MEESEKRVILNSISTVRFDSIHADAKSGALRTLAIGCYDTDVISIGACLVRPQYCGSTEFVSVASLRSMAHYLLTISTAGAGKTKLATVVVDDLINSLGPSDEALAWFYCKRNDAAREEPNSILRSLVRQLSVSRSGNGLQPHIIQVYEQHQRFATMELTNDDCSYILSKYVNIYPQTNIILDALDECDPDTRGQLLDIFDNLVKSSSKPVKFFISSRPDGDISYRFHGGPNIELSARDNTADIEKFVCSRIDSHDYWGKGKRKEMSPSLRGRVVQTLQERSDGM